VSELIVHPNSTKNFASTIDPSNHQFK